MFPLFYNGWMGNKELRSVWEGKKNLLLFVLVITLASLAFVCMEYVVSGREDTLSKRLFLFAVNYPFYLFLGSIDYVIVKWIHTKWSDKSYLFCTIASLVFSACVVNALAFSCNFLLAFFVENQIKVVFLLITLSVWNSIIVLAVELYLYSRFRLEAERKLAEVNREKIQYQYDALKNQINPHFLFNSLNVLASLAYRDADKTNRFAKKLSGVYRYLLVNNEQRTVTLQEELAFVDSFVYLQQIRFGTAFQFEIVGHEEHGKRKLIPVSLQLLVENALKHNISTAERPLFVHVCVDREGVTVSNNLQLRSSVDRSGWGLGSLQKQYAVYRLAVEIRQTESVYSVHLPFLPET